MGTIRKVVLCFSALCISRISAQTACTDVRGWEIKHGLHYIPGPDTCKLCICDNGHAKFCKAVLCSPPLDCRSFRVGSSCCDFICLDNVVNTPEDPNDALGMKLLTCAVTLSIIAALILLGCRVRRLLQKAQQNAGSEDQHSLNSIGYISGSYVGGTCETGLSPWKPHNYLPRGEAPPPYDEAVGLTRPEAMRGQSEATFHRQYQASVEVLAREDHHNYLNISRTISQMPNPSGCVNPPPLLAPHDTSAPHRILTHNVTVAYPSAIRLTGSLGAISQRGLLGLLREPDRAGGAAGAGAGAGGRPHNVPGYYALSSGNNMHSTLHRTIPRISSSSDAALLDAPLGTLGALGEARRSFHRPHDHRRNIHLSTDELTRVDSSSTISDVTTRGRPRAYSEEQTYSKEAKQKKCNENTDKTNATLLRAKNNVVQMPTSQLTIKNNVPVVSIAKNNAANVNVTVKGNGNTVPRNNAGVNANGKCSAAQNGTATNGNDGMTAQSLPLTVDQPVCGCSYAPAAEDDYRSECENCNVSAKPSMWVVEKGAWSAGTERTQTLQRLAPPVPPPPPHTATLPQPVARNSQLMMDTPSNWDNWFHTIPDSDTESEEE